MTDRKTYFANAFETTLTSSLAAGGTTINVADTTGSPAAPFYLTLEPGTDAKREVVLVSGKTSTTFTLTASTDRGLDGTTDITHDAGVAVKVVPVAAAMTDLHDRVDAVSTTATAAYGPGDTVPVADGGTGGTTAAAARTNLGLAIGTNVQAWSAVLDGTTASFTTADETKLDGIDTTALDRRDSAATADTLVLADAGKVVRYTAAGAVTATVPANATVAFALDSIINIYAAGAGGVTIAAAAGVTIRNNDAALAQYAEVSLRKDGTDEWVRLG